MVLKVLLVPQDFKDQQEILGCLVLSEQQDLKVLLERLGRQVLLVPQGFKDQQEVLVFLEL